MVCMYPQFPACSQRARGFRPGAASSQAGPLANGAGSGGDRPVSAPSPATGPSRGPDGLLSHQWVPRGHFCFYGCSCISRHLGFMFRLLLSSAKRCLEERRSFAPRRQP